MSQYWEDEIVTAGMHFHHGTAMCRIGSIHRVQHTKIIDTFGKVGEELADPEATLAVLPELPGGLEQVLGRIELDAWLGERERLAVVPCQQRFGVKRVYLRRAS